MGATVSRIEITCPQCGAKVNKEAGGVNRSRRHGAPVYCGRACAGIGRRLNKSHDQKVAEKAAYDAEYRKRNSTMLKAKKAAYYRDHIDREKEREKRKLRMPQHIEYCRRPKYREWKVEYDRQYRARKQFGAFGEAAIILNQLDDEIRSRASWIEVARDKGTLNKTQERKRDYARKTGNPVRC